MSGSSDNVVMVGQYLWGTLRSNRIMEYFLRDQLRQHPEVAPNSTLYLFEKQAPRVGVVALKQRMDVQAKGIRQMEKTCKLLRSRVDLLTYKANRLSKK